ncbi:MAG: LysM peptidoglycan-binding domain-containing protein [Chloroflexi bacterium]|nr:LysM peptidoglycan-binding domain-containing protein [Chloroflexota bacterium]
MLSRQKLFYILILLTITTLALTACVRPVPGGEEETIPAATDPDSGGGADGGAQPAPEGGDQTGGDEVQPAPEGGDQSGGSDDTQPAPEGGDQSGGGDDVQPAPEGGDQSGGGDEAQPAPEGGDQTGGDEAQPAPEGGDQTGGDPNAGGDADTGSGQTDTSGDTGGQPTDGSMQVGTPPTQEVVHIVQPGENLFRIGLQYGYSWVVLARYNGIPNPNYIYVGQPIRIPAAGGGGGRGATSGNYVNYVVQPGDNLFRIGLKYGISWVLIAEANGITHPHYIVPGQVLKIPVYAVPYS